MILFNGETRSCIQNRFEAPKKITIYIFRLTYASFVQFLLDVCDYDFPHSSRKKAA